MTYEEILEKVSDGIANQLGIHKWEVKPESLVAAELGADSLDMVEIVMHVEDYFEIEILDSEMSRLSTVQDWVNLVCEKRGVKKEE